MEAFETDVLVLGGGPAGLWSAIAAARAGARVVLADKARCGAAGPTAAGSTALWAAPPGSGRADAVGAALAHGAGLGDAALVHAVLEESYRRLTRLAHRGLRTTPVPSVVAGEDDPAGPGGPLPARVRVSGVMYLRALRRYALALGVVIRDNHPALRLLTDADGVVCAAAGLRTGTRSGPWTASARAVVLATGGCAFGSGAPGTEVDTGDGLLFGAEVGAELSGMEFAGAYALAPAMGGAPFGLGAGSPLHGAALHDRTGAPVAGAALFEALAGGRGVFARTAALSAAARRQVLRYRVLDQQGRVPLRPVLHGTVLGAGGLVTARDGATTVPGLFAAGDVTSREGVVGAGGGHGGAWAIASGVWAGAGAALFAGVGGPVPVRVPQGSGPVPAGLRSVCRFDPRAVVGSVREHTVPPRRSYWRSAGTLRDTVAELDALWPAARFELGGSGAGALRSRQAVALLAAARWSAHAALARAESRGLHRRTDHPDAAPSGLVRIRTGGLDAVWLRTDPLAGSDIARLGARRPRAVEPPLGAAALPPTA
ncbi:FAD-dependent oxidoreductase [Nocardia harenae]|uniref:FAD-dependent oxidoreductase n=1 Tax=Nocardia harenae TaxID=358707 RepID=UPI00082E6783|nr:FAD-binding protein [Nocardia harenae]